jgi:hypothetical protein
MAKLLQYRGAVYQRVAVTDDQKQHCWMSPRWWQIGPPWSRSLGKAQNKLPKPSTDAT